MAPALPLRKPSPGRSPRRQTRLRLVDVDHRFVRARDGTELSVRHWPGPKDRPTLVLCDGLGCDGYVWRYLVEDFAGVLPIVHWQYRGHGHSAVPDDLDSISMHLAVDDLEHVIDAFSPDAPVLLMGHSMGVQVCLEAYHQLPERVAGLSLVCGSYEHPIESFHGAATADGKPPVRNRMMRKVVFPLLTSTFIRRPRVPQRLWSRIVPMRVIYEFAIRTEVNGERLSEDDFRPYFHHIGHMDMRVFARFAKSLADHSAKHVLPTIDVPTFVVGAGKDTFTPGWRSDHMHAAIPDADYLFIVDGTHTAPIEHPELVSLRFEKFLEERFGLLR